MEEKIYDRQVTKQSLSYRVVDQQQIERHFTLFELTELYTFEPDLLDDPNSKKSKRSTSVVPKVTSASLFPALVTQNLQCWVTLCVCFSGYSPDAAITNLQRPHSVFPRARIPAGPQTRGRAQRGWSQSRLGRVRGRGKEVYTAERWMITSGDSSSETTWPSYKLFSIRAQ